MGLRRASVLLLLAGLGACARSPEEAGAGVGAETSAARIEHLRRALAALRARPEHQAAEVEVQHILLSVSRGGAAQSELAPDAAEALCAELFARAQAGEEFDTLERNHSRDVHPGIYRLSAGPTELPGVLAREDMIPGIGDVAWRLAVGEVGALAYDGGAADAPHSPRGYHVVKRLR